MVDKRRKTAWGTERAWESGENNSCEQGEGNHAELVSMLLSYPESSFEGRFL